MKTIPTRRAVLLFLVPVALMLAATGVEAQEDNWSFLVTPQVWVSHIEKNGLVSPSSLGGLQIFFGGASLKDAFTSRNSRAVDDLDPQWGLQLAAQKGRLTLAGSFQYVSFETRTDLVYTPPIDIPVSFTGGPCAPFNPCQFPNERVAQEFVNTTRMDMDLTASYLFPDVVPHILDLSLGGGLKFIYVSASREYGNLTPFASEVGAFLPAAFGRPGAGLYLVCERDDCSDARYLDRVKTKSWLYGVTIPMSAIFHLSSDARWLFPVSITPFLGAERRDDRNVVYALNIPDVVPPGSTSPLFGATVKRLDGTTFAYGFTSDATIRWNINDSLSAYAGMRVQFIEGHEKYLAWGPLVGMSVRFGGK